MERQPAITAYLTSKQLLLFALRGSIATGHDPVCCGACLSDGTSVGLTLDQRCEPLDQR